MSDSSSNRLTVEEYLAQEERSLERHEYLAGEIFLMSGGSLQHSEIGTNIIADLHRQLRTTHCKVRGPDTRIQTPSGLYTYADASVSCGPGTHGTTALQDPILLVEVLFDSTADYDRGKKFELYRSIESLRHYLIVAQDRRYVEHYVRGADPKHWSLTVHDQESDVLEFTELQTKLALQTIYDRVRL